MMECPYGNLKAIKMSNCVFCEVYEQWFCHFHAFSGSVNKLSGSGFSLKLHGKMLLGKPKTEEFDIAVHNGLFICPVAYCECKPYRSKCVCSKHAFTKHSWYYKFGGKPDVAKVFPEFSARANNYQLPKQVKTSKLSMFLRTATMISDFVR